MREKNFTMIWKIAKKEFLLNLVSARFVIGFLLCLFLIPFTLTVNIDDFDNRMRVYHVDKANADASFKEVRVYSYLRPEVVNPPEPLSIFCQGISSNVGNRVRIWLGEIPLFATGRAAIRDNPLLNSFFSIDFVGIIAIVMSLLALIFTYDACTREKEDGTLKLLLSNSLSRHRILLGKVVGVYLTLLPIILFCYILGTILILRSPDVSFSAGDWGRIILLFFLSLMYFMVFVFIGLLISARLKSSITSIIVCLFFWVFFVFIVPNLAVYLAQSLRTIQSYDNLQYVLQDLDKEFQHKCDEYAGTLEPPDWYMNWNMSGQSDGRVIITGNTKSSMERYRKLHEYTEPLRIEYADKKWLLQKAYLEDLNEQRILAERISLVSPSEVFRLVCASLCRTDVASHYRFMNRVRRYREQFIDFYKERKIFSSFLYFTPQPPETFLTADEIVRIRTGGEFKTFDEFREYFKTHAVTFVPLRKVEIPGTIFEEYPYLNLSDVPAFQWQDSGALSDLKHAFMRVAALIIVGMILFYLSFLSFLRYDVR
jgi:ABC-type transport system involved in multi-copper enzyme maturation permease subunit